MNTFSILTAQIGMFVIYMLAGVILIRTRVMNRENLEVISKFVIKLALPVMIFINTVNGVERKTLFHSLSIFLIAGIMYICLFLLSYISGIFFHLHGNHRQLYSAMSVFGNVGFMGIPIVTSIYPENGMLYICVFTIIDQLMLWTAGVRLTSGTDSQKNRFDFRKLINPVTVSIFLAVICVLTGIRLPEVLNNSLQKIGQTATPLALIYLGGAWACCLACFRFYSRSCFQACSPCCCPDFPWVYSRYSCCCSLSGCFSGYYGFWSDFVCLDFVFSRQNDSSFLLPPRPCNRCSLVLLFRHRQLLPEFVPVCSWR